jgi:Nup93/Nic96
VEDEEEEDGASAQAGAQAGLLYYCTYRYKHASISSSSNVNEWPEVATSKKSGAGGEGEEEAEEDFGATSATVFVIDLVGLVTAYLNHCLSDNPFAACDYLTLATYDEEEQASSSLLLGALSALVGGSAGTSSSSSGGGLPKTRQQELLAQLLAHSGAFAHLAGPLAIVNTTAGGATAAASGKTVVEDIGTLSLEGNPLRGYLSTHGTNTACRSEESLARIILRAGEIAHRAEGNTADALSLYLRVPFYSAGTGAEEDEDIGGLRPALSILIQTLSTMASDPWWSTSSTSSTAGGLIASARKRQGSSNNTAAQRELFKRVAAAVYSLPLPPAPTSASAHAQQQHTALETYQRALGPLIQLCTAYEALSRHDYSTALASIDASQLLPIQLANAASGTAMGQTTSASSWASVFDRLPEALKQSYPTLLLAAAEALRGLSSTLERRAAMIAGGSIGGAALDPSSRSALRSLKERCRALHSPPYPESMRRYVDGTVLAALQRVEAEMPMY